MAITIKVPDDMRKGKQHKMTTGVLEVVRYHRCDRVDCIFIDTGFETTQRAQNIRRGVVKDRLQKTLCGVGVLGVATPVPHVYRRWAGMLRRCYDSSDPAYHAYGGVGVAVCHEWHFYPNFEKWFLANHIEGLHMDKDLKAEAKANKEYAPSTVTFLSLSDNTKLSAKPVRLHHPDEGDITVNSLPEFCRESGFNYDSFRNSVVGRRGTTRSGWSMSVND